MIYDPQNPPPKKDFATGTSSYSRESVFRDILDGLRKRAYRASIPSKEYEGPPLSNSPLPVGAIHNPPPNRPIRKGTFGPSLPPTHDVNYSLATGTKQKFPKEKPVDKVAMNKTLDHVFDKTNRSSSIPVASGSATVRPSAPIAVPSASTVSLHDGRVINLNIKWGENNPSNLPGKRDYSPIPEDWEQEGCLYPLCRSKPASKAAYRTHRSRCKYKPK